MGLTMVCLQSPAAYTLRSLLRMPLTTSMGKGKDEHYTPKPILWDPKCHWFETNGALKLATRVCHIVCRDGTVTAGGAALISVLCSVGCLAIGAALAVYVMKQRVRQHTKREKRRAEVSTKQYKQPCTLCGRGSCTLSLYQLDTRVVLKITMDASVVCLLTICALSLAAAGRKAAQGIDVRAVLPGRHALSTPRQRIPAAATQAWGRVGAGGGVCAH